MAPQACCRPAKLLKDLNESMFPPPSRPPDRGDFLRKGLKGPRFLSIWSGLGGRSLGSGSPRPSSKRAAPRDPENGAGPRGVGRRGEPQAGSGGQPRARARAARVR